MVTKHWDWHMIHAVSRLDSNFITLDSQYQT